MAGFCDLVQSGDNLKIEKGFGSVLSFGSVRSWFPANNWDILRTAFAGASVKDTLRLLRGLVVRSRCPPFCLKTPEIGREVGSSSSTGITESRSL